MTNDEVVKLLFGRKMYIPKRVRCCNVKYNLWESCKQQKSKTFFFFSGVFIVLPFSIFLYSEMVCVIWDRGWCYTECEYFFLLKNYGDTLRIDCAIIVHIAHTHTYTRARSIRQVIQVTLLQTH